MKKLMAMLVLVLFSTQAFAHPCPPKKKAPVRTPAKVTAPVETVKVLTPAPCPETKIVMMPREAALPPAACQGSGSKLPWVVGVLGAVAIVAIASNGGDDDVNVSVSQNVSGGGSYPKPNSPPPTPKCPKKGKKK